MQRMTGFVFLSYRARGQATEWVCGPYFFPHTFILRSPDYMCDDHLLQEEPFSINYGIKTLEGEGGNKCRFV